MDFWHKIPLFFYGLFYPIKVIGKENIPEGKLVVVSNHFSAFDCAFFLKAYNKDVYFLAKKELFKNKLFTKILISYGAIPIDRDAPDMKSIISAIKVLKEGKKLVIYPEGTRNKTGSTELQPIKSGTVVFAVKAKCPIIPVMLEGKPRLFRKNYFLVGKPFYLEEFYDKKLSDDVILEMDNKVVNKMKETQLDLMEILKNKKRSLK